VPDWRTAQCRDAECSAAIIWAVTPSGKNTPVDAAPTADGNITLTGDTNPDQPPIATVVNPDAPPLGGWGRLHTSHFATCVAADRWRSKRTR